MRNLFAFISMFVILGFFSCNSSSNSDAYTKALKKGFGPRISKIPDTLALGFYTGMTKDQTQAHEKALVQSNKIKPIRDYDFDEYAYILPLTHFSESGNQTYNFVFRVSTEHYKDTLQALHLHLNASDNNEECVQIGNLEFPAYMFITLEDLYKEFSPIFESKGYVGKAVDTDKPHVWGEEGRGIEYRFVKNNTSIRLYKDGRGGKFISYYDLSVLYKEDQDREREKADKAKKENEANAAREEKKKDNLRNDF